VELTEQGILIRPPEKEHHGHDHAILSGNEEVLESDRVEVSSALSKVWQSLKARFTRSSTPARAGGARESDNREQR